MRAASLGGSPALVVQSGSDDKIQAVVVGTQVSSSRNDFAKHEVRCLHVPRVRSRTAFLAAIQVANFESRGGGTNC
jgi:hypothetical protein